MFGINYRPISVDTVFGRCRQRSLTQPPAHPNPKGHAYQSHSSVLCILCYILICWFLLQVQFKTFERGQTVQFVKIEQPRGKKCVNRIKSPFIVCLEIRHKKVRRGKRVRSSEFHKVLSDVKASWTLGYRCVSQQTQRSYQNRHAFLLFFCRYCSDLLTWRIHNIYKTHKILYFAILYTQMLPVLEGKLMIFNTAVKIIWRPHICETFGKRQGRKLHSGKMKQGKWEM